MMTRTATLIGATGLIGGHLYRLLLADGYYQTIRLLVRKPYPANDPRVEVRLTDFADAESLRLGLEGSDAIFCAVGTTQKKVGGDRDAYRKVDFDIPAQAARWGAERGARHFLLVSAVGANAASGNFYLRLKGEAEEAVRASGMPAVSVFRPSMLLGHRAEKRPGERIGQVASKIIGPLLGGAWRKYRPVEAEDVAAAMLAQSKRTVPGFKVLEYDAIRRLAGR
ncbi:MAG: NAD-dependent epimerase/dehydratase family protein [Chitinophagaceae bacterium]|nr:MAG: NAD-dependent epimerase/dehydratase family protein [Chitinophagaceae bacterium]